MRRESAQLTASCDIKGLKNLKRIDKRLFSIPCPINERISYSDSLHIPGGDEMPASGEPTGSLPPRTLPTLPLANTIVQLEPSYISCTMPYHDEHSARHSMIKATRLAMFDIRGCAVEEKVHGTAPLVHLISEKIQQH